MKKLIIALLVMFNGLFAFSQVTDSDIANSLLGKQEYEINPALDSLGVWYHRHIIEDEEKLSRVFSIANEAGTVKVFTLKLNKNQNYRIERIIVNYRHDDKNQVEDAKRVVGVCDLHVGKYSTDIIFCFK